MGSAVSLFGARSPVSGLAARSPVPRSSLAVGNWGGFPCFPFLWNRLGECWRRWLILREERFLFLYALVSNGDTNCASCVRWGVAELVTSYSVGSVCILSIACMIVLSSPAVIVV